MKSYACNNQLTNSVIHDKKLFILITNEDIFSGFIK